MGSLKRFSYTAVNGLCVDRPRENSTAAVFSPFAGSRISALFCKRRSVGFASRPRAPRGKLNVQVRLFRVQSQVKRKTPLGNYRLKSDTEGDRRGRKVCWRATIREFSNPFTAR